MAELSKQEIIINDLNSVQTQLSILINKYNDLFHRNADLELLLEEAKKENAALSQKVIKLQSELESVRSESDSNVFNTINPKEREDLKIKLQNLISRIDYHLSS